MQARAAAARRREAAARRREEAAARRREEAAARRAGRAFLINEANALEDPAAREKFYAALRVLNILRDE